MQAKLRNSSSSSSEALPVLLNKPRDLWDASGPTKCSVSSCSRVPQYGCKCSKLVFCAVHYAQHEEERGGQGHFRTIVLGRFNYESESSSSEKPKLNGKAPKLQLSEILSKDAKAKSGLVYKNNGPVVRPPDKMMFGFKEDKKPVGLKQFVKKDFSSSSEENNLPGKRSPNSSISYRKSTKIDSANKHSADASAVIKEDGKKEVEEHFLDKPQKHSKFKGKSEKIQYKEDTYQHKRSPNDEKIEIRNSKDEKYFNLKMNHSHKQKPSKSKHDKHSPSYEKSDQSSADDKRERKSHSKHKDEDKERHKRKGKGKDSDDSPTRKEKRNSRKNSPDKSSREEVVSEKAKSKGKLEHKQEEKHGKNKKSKHSPEKEPLILLEEPVESQEEEKTLREIISYEEAMKVYKTLNISAPINLRPTGFFCCRKKPKEISESSTETLRKLVGFSRSPFDSSSEFHMKLLKTCLYKLNHKDIRNLNLNEQISFFTQREPLREVLRRKGSLFALLLILFAQNYCPKYFDNLAENHSQLPLLTLTISVYEEFENLLLQKKLNNKIAQDAEPLPTCFLFNAGFLFKCFEYHNENKIHSITDVTKMVANYAGNNVQAIVDFSKRNFR